MTRISLTRSQTGSLTIGLRSSEDLTSILLPVLLRAGPNFIWYCKSTLRFRDATFLTQHCSREPKSTFNYETDHRLSSSTWHSDVTYEKQPPGLTALFLFDSPASGGDTGYADQRAAYEHLSPSFRAYLETLQVLHSGVAQAEYSRKGARGGIVKREPVENIHPLVRRHPVTGEKALFVNRQFSRKIIGLKEEESDAILELLYNHIEKGADFQTRLRWKPRTVTLWDSE